MGLREAFQKAAVAALKAAGNIAEDATLIINNDKGWGIEGSGAVSEYPIRLVFSTFQKRGTADVSYSFADAITDGDVKGLLASADLPAGAVIAVHEQVRRSNGAAYTIEGIDLDAAGALYVLLLRKG